MTNPTPRRWHVWESVTHETHATVVATDYDDAVTQHRGLFPQARVTAGHGVGSLAVSYCPECAVNRWGPEKGWVK